MTETKSETGTDRTESHTHSIAHHDAPGPSEAPGAPDARDLAARFAGGLSFEEMLDSAEMNVELYRNFRSRTEVPEEYATRIAATGRRWHLLVISEDWCGDSVNIVPWVDALASASPGTEMRLIGRDANADLMDLHLTNGRSRAIPIVLVLDDAFVERGWWGPRPGPMQEWFLSDEAQRLAKPERYRELRIRYARDRGRTTMEEIVQLIELAAAQDANAPSPTESAAS